LPAFAAATQQNDNCFAIAPIIHAISRAEIQSQFKYTFMERFRGTKISCFKAANVFINASRRYGIERIKPVGERRTLTFDILFNLK
jgi:hypothetical protein